MRQRHYSTIDRRCAAKTIVGAGEVHLSKFISAYSYSIMGLAISSGSS